MPCQSGVIGFNVELEMFLQAIVTEERHDRLCIEVVLMPSWLFGFRLNQQLTSEAYLLFIGWKDEQCNRQYNKNVLLLYW